MGVKHANDVQCSWAAINVPCSLFPTFAADTSLCLLQNVCGKKNIYAFMEY